MAGTFKTLVLKSNGEYVVIGEEDIEEIFTCSTPKLLPLTATKEAIVKLYPEYPIELVDLIDVIVTKIQ